MLMAVMMAVIGAEGSEGEGTGQTSLVAEVQRCYRLDAEVLVALQQVRLVLGGVIGPARRRGWWLVGGVWPNGRCSWWQVGRLALQKGEGGLALQQMWLVGVWPGGRCGWWELWPLGRLALQQVRLVRGSCTPGELG